MQSSYILERLGSESRSYKLLVLVKTGSFLGIISLSLSCLSYEIFIVLLGVYYGVRFRRVK